MYYVLYIDVLFLENLLLDYLLLTVTARLLKLSPGRLRRILSAALGSLLLCLIYAALPQCPLPVFLLLHGAGAAAMIYTGLGTKSLRIFGKALILLYLCSFLLGGIFGWLQNIVKLPVYPFLGLSLLSYWLLTLGMRWLMRFRQREQHIYPVTLGFHGHTIKTRGLIDTGNSLRDPVFGKPVSILPQDLKLKLCGTEKVLLYPVPFHSIGKKSGLLPAFYADFLQIETEGGTCLRVERPLLGVTKEPLSSKKEYGILLHPDLLEPAPSAIQADRKNAEPEHAYEAQYAHADQFSGGNQDNAD